MNFPFQRSRRSKYYFCVTNGVLIVGVQRLAFLESLASALRAWARNIHRKNG
jgi:hypothetical protein